MMRSIFFTLVTLLAVTSSCVPDRQVDAKNIDTQNQDTQKPVIPVVQPIPTEQVAPNTQVFECTSVDQSLPKGPKKICLNMIVKNESAVITRCLESVKPMIDYWVIVDTGSTDNTQNIIRDFMKDIPGELHERPWVNFGHNRTEALKLAKGKADYVLIIDADETLEFSPGFTRPELDKDFYFITTKYAGTTYGRVQLVNDRLPWKWVGVLHEALDSPFAMTNGSIEGVANIVRTDGARSQDPRKFHKDAEVLEKALLTEPDNSRYVFYLAQSYKDAGEHELAIKNYRRRIAMGGFDQELFWSMLQIGILQEELKKDPQEIIQTYTLAHRMRPSRAEPLYRLASFHRRQGDYASCVQIARKGLAIPLSNDLLFLENWIYDFGLLLEYSIGQYWLENYLEAKIASQLLLTNPNLPENYRNCVEKNLWWNNQKILEQFASMQSVGQSCPTGTDG